MMTQVMAIHVLHTSPWHSAAAAFAMSARKSDGLITAGAIC